MSEEKEDSAWTYSITKNKIFLNGQETSLTTDDVSWAEDVQASGITPFGGITLDTVWKKNQTLTDTMRQLIQKIISRLPSVSVTPSETTILIDDTSHYNQVFEFSFDEGKYAYDNTTGCKLTSLSMTYKNDEGSTVLFDDASISEYAVSLTMYTPIGLTVPGTDSYGVDTRDGSQLIVKYSYSKGNAPTISGAGETFIEDSTIQAGSGEITYTIHSVSAVRYGFSSTSIDDFLTVLNETEKWLDYETNTTKVCKNAVGDTIFAIFIPQSLHMIPKLYYHMNYSDASTGVDYSDLFSISTYKNPLIVAAASNQITYDVYYIQMIEPFKDINEFTIVLEEVD